MELLPGQVTALPLRGTNIERALTIPGWMEPDELTWLAEQALQARSIIEVGSWKGRSTRALADHCPGRVHVADHWEWFHDPADQAAGELLWHGGRAIFSAWLENLSDHLESGRLRFLPRRSTEAARFFEVLTAKYGRVDFVFLDADHSREGCGQDIDAYRPLVRDGGLIAGHDYTTAAHPGVKEAVDAAFGGRVQRGPGSIWFVTI